MDLQPLPAFDDNYVWLLRDAGGAQALSETVLAGR